MAVWAIKPGCLSQEAVLTGQQMVPWHDHWKLVALVLRQILYKVVAKFLRYRWHSLVEEPQGCAGICMPSPLVPGCRRHCHSVQPGYSRHHGILASTINRCRFAPFGPTDLFIPRPTKDRIR